jgi:hypothetical protein
MIKHISLPHGWYYFYRIHELKSSLLLGKHGNLMQYLDKVFDDCPHDNFVSGPRSSHLRFELGADMVEVQGHEICSWAEQGLQNDRYKTAHSKVQVTMLENDPKTFAVEVPIWLEPDDIKQYHDLFDTREPLSGHIDLLRFEDGKIWVWDYKPRAENERYAPTQVFFYALMLSKRTGISLDNFMCGYFDQHTSFVFKPSLSLLKKF